MSRPIRTAGVLKWNRQELLNELIEAEGTNAECNQTRCVCPHISATSPRPGEGKALANVATPPPEHTGLEILTWKPCHLHPDHLSNRREWSKQKNEWNQTKSSLQKIYYFNAILISTMSSQSTRSSECRRTVLAFFLLLCNTHLQCWKIHKLLKTRAVQNSTLHVLHVTTEQGFCACKC